MYASVSIKKDERNFKDQFVISAGREISVINGRPEKEVLCVEHTWGYFSEKDGENHRFDLCEECYDRLLKGFLIPAEIEK